MHILKSGSTGGRLSLSLSVAAALVLAVTGCSAPASTGGSPGAPTDAAVLSSMASKVAALREPSNTFVAPGPKLDGTSLKGQSVWYVSLSQAIPVLGREQNGLQQAAAALGMSVHICDGKFQPALSTAKLRSPLVAK